MEYNPDHFRCISCGHKFLPHTIHWYAIEIIPPPVRSLWNEKKWALKYECPECFTLQWCHLTIEDLYLIKSLITKKVLSDSLEVTV